MKILFSLVVCFIILADVKLTTANCSGGVTYYTESNGTITSPNYPDDYDHDDECIWEIKTAEGGNIILIVDDIDIQENVGCTLDYLLVKNAYNHDYTWIRRCGDTGFATSGTRDSAYIVFHTDSSVSGRGFRLSWEESNTVAPTTPTTTTAAGSSSAKSSSVAATGSSSESKVVSLLKTSSGTIESPDYPENYANNENCQWEISTESGADIVLTIVEMDIPLNEINSCLFDYLLIANGYDHTDEWYEGCGSASDVTVTGKTDKAFIKFVSSSGTTGEGFRLKWQEKTSGSGTTTQSPDINAIIAGSVVGAAVFIGSVVAFACIVCRKNSACYYKNCGKSNEESKKPQSNRGTSSLAFANEKTAKANSNRTPKGLSEKPMKKEESAAKQTKTMVKKVENLSQKAVPMDPKSNKSVDSSAQNKVAPAVAVKKEKKSTEQQDEPKPVLPHIMISYQWDVKEKVLEFRDMLKEAGYRVWIDVEQMHKHTSTFESMAKAVENSVLVIPVLTEQYQQSLNCRKEIEYADRRKVLLIPISMQSGFTPSSWLGFLLGHTRSYEMANPEKKEREAERLLSSLAELAKAAKEPEDEDEEDS